MVFISSILTLEELLEREKENRIENLDWFLFDAHISSRTLKSQRKNYGNLRTYMRRIFYYPYYYDKPLHCYLIKDSEFEKLDFFDEKNKNIAAIWNMKRIPNESLQNTYVKIPKEKHIFGKDCDTNKYIEKKFLEFNEKSLNETPIIHIVL